MAKEYFTASMEFARPEPRHRLCIRDKDVTLQQRGKNNFLVRYGRQVKAGLTYSEACEELGACMMHQSACEDGGVDNRMPGEN